MNSSYTYELENLVDVHESQLKDYFLENKINLFDDRIIWQFKNPTSKYISEDKRLRIIFKSKFKPIWELEGIPESIKVGFTISIDDENDFNNFLDKQEDLFSKIIQLSLPVDSNNTQGNLNEVLNNYQQTIKVKLKVWANQVEVSILITFKKINEADNVFE